MSKLLTIAIPTYNRKKYLEKALKSIYSQFDERLEVLVSDNCSEDGTQEFVVANYPDVVYYRNEENVGMENFKRCYDRARGDFILLLGDDDIIVDGTIKIILDFLQNNKDLRLVFLNHTFFIDEFDGTIGRPFASIHNGNFVTTSKDMFINIARHQLTLISCMVLSREAYLRIEKPERYVKNWFLQTCVEFEATKEIDAKLGIISDICVAQNLPRRNVSANMDVYVDVFVLTEQKVFEEIGVNCGYKKKIMRKIYSDFICKNFPIYILSCKAKNISWKEPFWRKAYPALKKYPRVWVTIMPAALTPSWLAKMLYVVKHRIMRK